MILIASGDSFIFGNELSDWTPRSTESSNKTFAALLSKEVMDMEYFSCARPGNSNDAIQRMAIQQVEHRLEEVGDKMIVLVAWTFVPRFEFPFNYNVDSPTAPFASISVYKDSNRPAVKDFANTFFKHVGTDWYQHYNTVKSILLLQNYLKSKNIPYLFTITDNIVLAYKEDRQLKPYWDMVDFSNWFFFPPATEPHKTTTPRGFYQWARENKYDVGPDQHPLDQAHFDAAQLMKDKFNELVKKTVV